MHRPTLVKLLAALLFGAAFSFPAPALAQPPDTLAAVIPPGVVYALDGTAPLPAETVAAWRAVPILEDAAPDYARGLWVDAAGRDLGVQWERAYPVALDGGGRALMLVGRTVDPARVVVMAAYADRAETLADGRTAWHGLRAVIVARADVEG